MTECLRVVMQYIRSILQALSKALVITNHLHLFEC